MKKYLVVIFLLLKANICVAEFDEESTIEGLAFEWAKAQYSYYDKYATYARFNHRPVVEMHNNVVFSFNGELNKQVLTQNKLWYLFIRSMGKNNDVYVVKVTQNCGNIFAGGKCGETWLLFFSRELNFLRAKRKFFW